MPGCLGMEMVSGVSVEKAPSVVLGPGLSGVWLGAAVLRGCCFVKTKLVGHQCQHCAQGSLAKINPFPLKQIAL